MHLFITHLLLWFECWDLSLLGSPVHWVQSHSNRAAGKHGSFHSLNLLLVVSQSMSSASQSTLHHHPHPPQTPVNIQAQMEPVCFFCWKTKSMREVSVTIFGFVWEVEEGGELILTIGFIKSSLQTSEEAWPCFALCHPPPFGPPINCRPIASGPPSYW